MRSFEEAGRKILLEHFKRRREKLLASTARGSKSCIFTAAWETIEMVPKIGFAIGHLLEYP
jgi:hypothetical protein